MLSHLNSKPTINLTQSIIEAQNFQLGVFWLYDVSGLAIQTFAVPAVQRGVKMCLTGWAKFY